MLGNRPITLRAPLDPVALAHRLQAALPKVPDAAGVYGNGSQYEMHLIVYRPKVRNDLQSRLDAELIVEGAGTRIVGRIGPPRAAMIFMGCWMTFVALFAIGGVIAVFLERIPAALPFLLVPLSMAAIGAWILWWGRRGGAADEAAMLTFLKDTIGAEPV